MYLGLIWLILLRFFLWINLFWRFFSYLIFHLRNFQQWLVGVLQVLIFLLIVPKLLRQMRIVTQRVTNHNLKIRTPWSEFWHRAILHYGTLYFLLLPDFALEILTVFGQRLDFVNGFFCFNIDVFLFGKSFLAWKSHGVRIFEMTFPGLARNAKLNHFWRFFIGFLGLRFLKNVGRRGEGSDEFFRFWETWFWRWFFSWGVFRGFFDRRNRKLLFPGFYDLGLQVG